MNPLDLLTQNQYTPSPDQGNQTPTPGGFNLSDFMNSRNAEAPDTQDDSGNLLSQFIQPSGGTGFNYKELIDKQLKRSDDSEQKIKELSEKVGYDPLQMAKEKYKDLYKWNGASKTRKLGTIGIGALDLAAMLSGSGAKPGKGLKERMEEKEVARHKILSYNAEREIGQNRQTQNNANTTMAALAGQATKAETDRAKSEAANQMKLILGKMTDKQKAAEFSLKMSNALVDNDLKRAKELTLEATTELTKKKTSVADIPTNLVQSAAMEQRNMVPTGTTAAGSQAIKDSKFAPNSNPLPSMVQGSEKIVFGKDANGNFTRSFEKPISLVDRRTGVQSQVSGKSGGVEYTPAEFKPIQQMQDTHNMLNLASTSLLDDLRSGRISQYSGVNEIPFIRNFKTMIEPDVQNAIARSMGTQSTSMATLQHLKAMYGGRAPQELTNDISQLVEGRMSSPIQKTSAIISQKIMTEAYLNERAGDEKSRMYFQDPGFYRFVKGNVSAIVGMAKGGASVKPPTVDDMIKQYELFKLNKAGDKGTSNDPATQEYINKMKAAHK